MQVRMLQHVSILGTVSTRTKKERGLQKLEDLTVAACGSFLI